MLVFAAFVPQPRQDHALLGDPGGDSSYITILSDHEYHYYHAYDYLLFFVLLLLLLCICLSHRLPDGVRTNIFFSEVP